jgi:tetratricopeptide (TPR) repeat protein
MRIMERLLHRLPIATRALVETAGPRISIETDKRASTLLGARFRLLATIPMSSLT